MNMKSKTFDKFKHISGKRDWKKRELFLDMVNNPEKYKGFIVYLKEVDEDELYDPFVSVKKYYFNEGGIWQTGDMFGAPTFFEE